MKRAFRLGPKRAAFLGILAVLAAFFAALYVILNVYQENYEKEKAAAAARADLVLAGQFLHEALLKRRYQDIEQLLVDWAEEETNITSLKAVAPNGFMVVDYDRPTPASKPLRIRHEIRHGDTVFLTLEMVRDFGPLDEQLIRLDTQAIAAFLAFTLLLAGLIWLIVRDRDSDHSSHDMGAETVGQF